MEVIAAAAITGVLALIGVILTCRSNNRKIEQKLEITQAITSTKLDCLKSEVSKYNEIAVEVPVLKRDIQLMRDDLEKLKQYHTERV